MITYTATLRPDARSVTVAGVITGASPTDVLGWDRPPHDYAPSSPAPDKVRATPAGVRFAPASDAERAFVTRFLREVGG